MGVLVLLAYTVCVGIVSAQRPEGVCNVRQCGCPPYWHHWCTKDNAKVHYRECQESPRVCEWYCGEEWCHGGPKPQHPLQVHRHQGHRSLRCRFIITETKPITYVIKPTTRMPTINPRDM